MSTDITEQAAVEQRADHQAERQAGQQAEPIEQPTTRRTADAEPDTYATPEPDADPWTIVGAGEISCRYCGIVTPRPMDDTEILWAAAADTADNPTSRSVGAQPEPLGKCPSCGTVDDLVAAIMERQPRLLGIYRAATAERVADCIIGWRVLGKKPRYDQFDLTRWRVWIDKFAAAGSDCRWQRQWSPIQHHRTGTATRTRYGHVDDELRATLRRRYAAAMQAGIGGHRRLTPPPIDRRLVSDKVLAIESGCMWCGVGSVEATSDKSGRQVWHYQTCRLSSIGGRGNQHASIAGWLDPDCAANLASVDEHEPLKLALDRAIVTAFDATTTWGPDDRLQGMPAWALLYADAVDNGHRPPTPNRRPWAHLGDPGEVRRIVIGDDAPRDRMWIGDTYLDAASIAGLLIAGGYRLEKADRS